jgi:hypothetical protein
LPVRMLSVLRNRIAQNSTPRSIPLHLKQFCAVAYISSATGHSPAENSRPKQ